MNNDPMFIVVDLFCGAGGTTTGFIQAELEGMGLAKVIACINHDPKAIKSHWLNYPEVKHFEEDIRTLDLTELVKLVKFYKKKYPNAYLILWASLECTNFSKAKGGQPRLGDSRTLAESLLKKWDAKKKKYVKGDSYIQLLKPDYVQIENVVEFMGWGPLNEHGKPENKKNGRDWMKWRKQICDLGYNDQWRELNSANYGAYTSRNRLFGAFAKNGLPICFPDATHAKVPSKFSMHGDLQKWKAVKDVLNFEDEGQSIFTRKKPLSDKTLERIFAGLVKYVAKGDKAFLSKYFSGRPKGKVNSVNDPCSTVTTFGGSTLVQTKSFSDLSVDSPAGTITTKDHHALVQASFITQRNSGDPDSKIVDIDGPARTLTATGGNQDLVLPFLVKYNSTDKNGNYYPPDMDSPSPVITTQNRLYLASAQFLAGHYSNGANVSSVLSPCPTISTKDRFQLIRPEWFIDKHFGVAAQNQSIENPAGTILPNDKHRLIQVDPFIMPTNYDNMPRSVEEPAPSITADRHHTYIVNPSHGGHTTSTEAPCPVIVARQDKAPLYLIQAEKGLVAIEVYETDTEPLIRIKQFMVMFGLVDIKMRMLRVPELLLIQGLSKKGVATYKLEGNQSDQKKFIGNSVVPEVVKAWTESMAKRLIGISKSKAA